MKSCELELDQFPITLSVYQCEWFWMWIAFFFFGTHCKTLESIWKACIYLRTYVRLFVVILLYTCCSFRVVVFFFLFFRRFIALYTHKLIACFVQLSWFQVIVLRDKTCIQFWSLNTKPLLIYIRAVCVGFVPPDDDGKKCLNN